MPKHFADEQYRLACSEPYLWICKAKEVRRAADTLWHQFEQEIQAYSHGEDRQDPLFGTVALMLYGLAMENLLKAGLAAKGMASGPNGNFGLKFHDLEKLSDKFGLALSPTEAEFVERLQQFVEWAGRYPIPLTREGLYPREMLDGGKCVLYGYGTSDGPKAVDLLSRIEHLLPTEDEAVESYVRSYRA